VRIYIYNYEVTYDKTPKFRMQIATMFALFILFQTLNYVSVVDRYVKGFITRDGPPTDENQRFIRYMKYNYLMMLKKKLPKSVLDKSWPPSPAALSEVCLSLSLSLSLSLCIVANTDSG